MSFGSVLLHSCDYDASIFIFMAHYAHAIISSTFGHL